MINQVEAIALAMEAGCCAEIAPNGFICTRPLHHPHDEHRAAIMGGEDDGHLLEVWPVDAA